MEPNGKTRGSDKIFAKYFIDPCAHERFAHLLLLLAVTFVGVFQ